MNIQQALQKSEVLQNVSDSPDVDVEVLLCHVLGKTRSYLFTWPEKSLSPEAIQRFEGLLAQRQSGVPVAHITGTRGFWSFDLDVSPATLIPRPDTEVLVETALSLCSQDKARVADLGTGTGAIALALASEKPQWDVIASDYVAEAAALAEQNRAKLGLNNVTVLQGSWFDPHEGHYHLIVSNPPYIDPTDPHLTQGDVRFEPLTALIAEGKGLADIALIIQQATQYLHQGGILMFEHGYDQAVACQRLMKEQGYKEVATAKDYGQNDRVTYGYWFG